MTCFTSRLARPGPVRPVVIVVLAVLAVASVRPASAQANPYTAPVDAPVVEAYSAPASPYGAGNRGIDYATTPGQEVRAAAAGTVRFAGPVAGALHVTVAHPDGIRTTYAFVASVVVRAGQVVAAGDVVATAGPRLHLSARLGEAYLDPAVLLAAGGPATVRLLPDTPTGAPATTPAPPAAPTAAAAPGSTAWLDRSPPPSPSPSGYGRAAGSMLFR